MPKRRPSLRQAKSPSDYTRRRVSERNRRQAALSTEMSARTRPTGGIYQTFLSALVLLICAAVQMATQHRRELQETIPERQALALNGLQERQLGWMFPLHTFFADLFCLLLAIAVSGIMGSVSMTGFLAGGIGWAAHLVAVAPDGAEPRRNR